MKSKKESSPTKGELLQDKWGIANTSFHSPFGHQHKVIEITIGTAKTRMCVIKRHEDAAEEAKEIAATICQAINERQKLLDSHKELLEALDMLWERCKDKGTAIHYWDTIETALTNAKNIQP